jgi:hypothetical protein
MPQPQMLQMDQKVCGEIQFAGALKYAPDRAKSLRKHQALLYHFLIK